MKEYRETKCHKIIGLLDKGGSQIAPQIRHCKFLLKSLSLPFPLQRLDEVFKSKQVNPLWGRRRPRRVSQAALCAAGGPAHLASHLSLVIRASPSDRGTKLVPAAAPLVNQAEQTMQMRCRASAPGTLAPLSGVSQSRSSCTDLSPQTLRCHTNVIIAKHQILKTIQSEFISSLLGKGFSSPCDKLQTPDPLLLWGGGARGVGAGVWQVTRADDPSLPPSAEFETSKPVLGALSSFLG